MEPNAVSVFDLSPPEKLQLVEDLWDDLAANPSGFLSTSGRRRNWRERKANLMSNPASGLSWEEVKRECEAAMEAKLVIALRSGADVADAYGWYEQRAGV